MVTVKLMETKIVRCKDCKDYEDSTFTIPVEESNPGMSNHETKYYAYCNNMKKFIVPIRNYAPFLMEGVIKFPEFCPLESIEN